MFAIVVNEGDSSTDEKTKAEAIRQLIEFHVDIKEYVRSKNFRVLIC